METMTLEAGAAALAAMIRGLGQRLDALNGQGGWTNVMAASAGGVPEWMEAPGGMERVPPDAARAGGIPWGTGRAQEMPTTLPAREHPAEDGSKWASSGEMDAESMGRLVADTVNREIGRLARARRYTG